MKTTLIATMLLSTLLATCAPASALDHVGYGTIGGPPNQCADDVELACYRGSFDHCIVYVDLTVVGNRVYVCDARELPL